MRRLVESCCLCRCRWFAVETQGTTPPGSVLTTRLLHSKSAIRRSAALEGRPGLSDNALFDLWSHSRCGVAELRKLDGTRVLDRCCCIVLRYYVGCVSGRHRWFFLFTCNMLIGELCAVLSSCFGLAEQFQSPPVGPLGAYIKLKDECKQFRVCIEGHLSKNLNNFVVSCQE